MSKKTNILATKEEILAIQAALLHGARVTVSQPGERIYPAHARIWDSLERALRRLS